MARTVSVARMSRKEGYPVNDPESTPSHRAGAATDPKGAARYCGVSRTVIYDWMGRGLLAYSALPGSGDKQSIRRILYADLDALLERFRKEIANGQQAEIAQPRE
jgi:hypothetical protein